MSIRLPHILHYYWHVNAVIEIRKLFWVFKKINLNRPVYISWIRKFDVCVHWNLFPNKWLFVEFIQGKYEKFKEIIQINTLINVNAKSFEGNLAVPEFCFKVMKGMRARVWVCVFPYLLLSVVFWSAFLVRFGLARECLESIDLNVFSVLSKIGNHIRFPWTDKAYACTSVTHRYLRPTDNP